MQKSKIHIQERRRTISKLLAQSMTETEIAKQLGVNVSTICRDIKVLKQLAQQFVYELAKSDLAYYYKQCIDGIEEVQSKAWEIYRDNDNVKGRLLALKLVKECQEGKFALFSHGPSTLNIRSLELRLSQLESTG